MRRSSTEDLGAGRHDVRSLVQLYWPLAVLGILAIAVAIVAHHMLFPAYSWNRDEPVYIWQVKALRQGHIRATDGGAVGLLRPWLSGAEDGVVFSHFPVGWPLVLLAGDVIFGSPEAGLGFAALLVVLGTYALARELTGDHVLALVAAGVMVFSPILAIQGGIYLGYVFTLGIGLLFAAALLSGVRRALPRRIAASGALLGWVLLTRPFDAVLWGAAVVGYLVFVRRREWRLLIRPAGWFAAGLLPLVVATLVYNRLATGSITQFPNTASDPLDKFGFGPRRIMPGFGKFDYGLREALKGTAKNAYWTPMFLAGSYLGAVAAAVGLWLRRRDQSTLALLTIGAVFPLGYFFFWGTSISSLTARLSGPIYFVPAYAPLSILIATAILAAWRRRRALGMGLLAALVIATLPAAVNRLDVNRNLSRAQLPWKRATQSISGRALVFVAGTGRYLLFLNPYSANNPDINGRIMFAADRGATDLDLIAAHPDRTPYIQQASVPPSDLGPQTYPRTPTISVTRLHVVRGRSISLRVRITNPKHSRTVAAYIKVGRSVRWRTLAIDPKAGATFETEWRVGLPALAASDRSMVALTHRLGSVTVGVGYGRTAEVARNEPKTKQIFPFRVHNDVIEMLPAPLKATASTGKPQHGKPAVRAWKLVSRLTNLQVDIAPGPGSAAAP